MIPAFEGNIPPPTVNAINKDGTFAQSWKYLIQQLWNRTGGGSGIPNTVDNPLAAGGATQATATALTEDLNEIAPVGLGSGVMLSALKPGQSQTVFNNGANPLNVFPQVGVQIDTLGANLPYVLAAGKTQIYSCYGTTEIRSLQLG